MATTALQIMDRLRELLIRYPALRHVDLRERWRRGQILQHKRGLRTPPVTGRVVPDKAVAEDDIAIAARLLAAHQAATKVPTSTDRVDLWTGIYDRQRTFAEILLRGDDEELARYLCNVSRHDASIGIIQGDTEFHRIIRSRAYRNFLLLFAKDALVSLAEGLGVLSIENPAQGDYGANLRMDPGDLVSRASQRLGIDITPPDVDGGLLKLDTTRGLFGERDLNAIYTAHLLRSVRPNTSRTCEIGGGSGRVAYWSHRLGLRSYTIVDLPHANVVQGYYLLKNLPEDQVLLFGEQPAGDPNDYVRILPAQAIGDLSKATYDVVLNQDSFPEMHLATVEDYLRWIQVHCVGDFVNINHENTPSYGRGLVQTNVFHAIQGVGGFVLKHRSPYWMRKGYVLEQYGVTREAMAGNS